MKIQAQVYEVAPIEYTDKKSGDKVQKVKVSVLIPHDDPAHGLQSLGGMLEYKDFNRGKMDKFPWPCTADVSMASRVVNGYPTTTLNLVGVSCD